VSVTGMSQLGRRTNGRGAIRFHCPVAITVVLETHVRWPAKAVSDVVINIAHISETQPSPSPNVEIVRTVGIVSCQSQAALKSHKGSGNRTAVTHVTLVLLACTSEAAFGANPNNGAIGSAPVRGLPRRVKQPEQRHRYCSFNRVDRREAGPQR
jgi:hypothetical protein